MAREMKVKGYYSDLRGLTWVLNKILATEAPKRGSITLANRRNYEFDTTLKYATVNAGIISEYLNETTQMYLTNNFYCL